MKTFTVRGTHYGSMTELASAYRLTVQTVSRRMRAGWSVEQAIGLNPPPKREATNQVTLVTSKGTYKSIRAASEISGVTEANIQARLKLGWSADQACGYEDRPQRESNNSQRTVCAGKSYPSKTALAAAYDLPAKRVRKRLRNGWSAEQAVGLEEPPPRYRNTDGSAREHSWVKPTRNKKGQLHAESADGNYLLYVIENSVNDKKYVGITTTSLNTRFYLHKAAARKSKSKTSKLYNAIKKLGEDNFAIRLLRDDASSIDELLDQEVAAIKEMQTIKKGYNTSTGGTIGTGRAIKIADMSFDSIGQAANHFGVDPAIFSLRIGRLGWAPEEAAELIDREKWGRRNKAITVNHQGQRLEFPSIASAEKFFGIKRGTAHARISKGWSVTDALSVPIKTTRSQVVVEGKSYKSLREISDVMGLSYQSVTYYLRKSDLSLEEIIYVLSNKLSTDMQRIMVSEGLGHKAALRKLKRLKR